MGIKEDLTAAVLAVNSIIENNQKDTSINLKKEFINGFLASIKKAKKRIPDIVKPERHGDFTKEGFLASEAHSVYGDGVYKTRLSTILSFDNPQPNPPIEKTILDLGEAFGLFFGAIEYGILHPLFPISMNVDFVKPTKYMVALLKKHQGQINFKPLQQRLIALTATRGIRSHQIRLLRSIADELKY